MEILTVNDVVVVLSSLTEVATVLDEFNVSVDVSVPDGAADEIWEDSLWKVEVEGKV